MAGLKARQIRLLLEGRIAHSDYINSRDQQETARPGSGTGIKPMPLSSKIKRKLFPKTPSRPSMAASRPDVIEPPKIENTEDILRSGVFNVVDKRRKKKRKPKDG